MDTKCQICENLNIKIEDLHETLSKYIKDRDNLDKFLSNQIETYIMLIKLLQTQGWILLNGDFFSKNIDFNVVNFKKRYEVEI